MLTSISFSTKYYKEFVAKNNSIPESSDIIFRKKFFTVFKGKRINRGLLSLY